MAVVAAWSLLAAPLGAQTTVASPEDAALRARIQAYWDARLQERYPAEYSILEPSLRARLTLPRFVLGRQNVHFLEFQLEGVEISGPMATARVRTSYELELPPPPEGMRRVGGLGDRVKRDGAILEEQWVKVGETWYKRVPEQQ